MVFSYSAMAKRNSDEEICVFLHGDWFLYFWINEYSYFVNNFTELTTSSFYNFASDGNTVNDNERDDDDDDDTDNGDNDDDCDYTSAGQRAK